MGSNTLKEFISFFISSLEVEYYYFSFTDGYFDSLFSECFDSTVLEKGKKMRDFLKSKKQLVISKSGYYGKSYYPYKFFAILPIKDQNEIIGYFVCAKHQPFSSFQKVTITRGISFIEKLMSPLRDNLTCKYKIPLCEIMRIFNSQIRIDKKMDYVFKKLNELIQINGIVYVDHNTQGFFEPEFFSDYEIRKYQNKFQLSKDHFTSILNGIRANDKDYYVYKRDNIFPDLGIGLIHTENVVVIPLNKYKMTSIGFIVYYGEKIEQKIIENILLLKSITDEFASAIALDMHRNEYLNNILDLTIFSDLLNKINEKEVNVDDIMHLVMNIVPRTTLMKRCILYLLDDKNKHIIPSYSNSDYPLLESSLLYDRQLEGHNVFYKILKSRKPLIIYDAQDEKYENFSLAFQSEMKSVILIPIVSKNEDHPIGILSLDNNDFRIFKERDINYYKMIAKQIGRFVENSPVINRIGDRVYKDMMLDVYNKNYILQCIDKFMESDTDFTVIIIDLDHYKRINDQYGHLFGDRLLKEVIGIIKENIRKLDILGRFGGDEFVLLLPETPIDIVQEVANRIRLEISQYPFEYQVKVTLSVGIANRSMSNETGEAILHLADLALYESKSKGRDCITFFEQKMLVGGKNG